MKLKIRFFDEQIIKKELKGLEHLNFSLFLETIPESQDELSDINILVLYEPNEYFGLHDWAIQNKEMFDCILNKSYGHGLRHEVMNRKSELTLPTNFHQTIGDRHNIEDARLGKETVLCNSQFGVAIENFSHRNWFSEKILDCFLLKTIPIYWGCSNIGDYFNAEGIILFRDVDDLIYKLNGINEEFYESKKEIIEENWKLALDFVYYEKNIALKIKEIFKLNKLI